MSKFFSKIENVFVLVCLFWGVLFLIINPPFQASDEPSHMYRMYGFTQGVLTLEKKNISGQTQVGLTLPVNLLLTAMQNYAMINHPTVKTHPSLTQKLFKIPLEPQKTAFCAFSVPAYTPVSYFPVFIALWVMKLLNMSPILIMYILRFCTLLTYLSLIYFAIKITPVKKWLFFSAAIVHRQYILHLP